PRSALAQSARSRSATIGRLRDAGRSTTTLRSASPGGVDRYGIDMKKPSKSGAPLRYGTAALAVAMATIVRLALDPVLGDRFPFATLFFAVLVAAGAGGRGPGLFATVLGALAATTFLLTPRGVFAVEGAEDRAGMVVYLAVGAGIALMGGALHSA